MRRVAFSADDLGGIAWDRYHHPEPHVQRKMEILWLKHHGLTHQAIARLAGVARSTVQRTLDAFRAGGLDQVRRCRWARPGSILDEYRLSLEEHFRAHPPRSVKEAQAVIHARTGVQRGLTQVRHFLRRLGLKPRKVAAIPIPPKQTAEEHARAQRRFLEEQLMPRLAEARAGHRDVYFVDAAHFVYAAFLGWVWCLARWCMRAASGRKRYNVLGALHAVSHRLVRVANHSYINAESVCALLRAVAAGAKQPLTLVLDNARYQKCALVQELARSLGVELLYLPSYSPNLNLIERVWKFVKKQCLQSIEHTKYEEFTGAIDECLEQLAKTHKAKMDSLLTHNFQLFESVSLLVA